MDPRGLGCREKPPMAVYPAYLGDLVLSPVASQEAPHPHCNTTSITSGSVQPRALSRHRMARSYPHQKPRKHSSAALLNKVLHIPSPARMLRFAAFKLPTVMKSTIFNPALPPPPIPKSANRACPSNTLAQQTFFRLTSPVLFQGY